MYLYQQHIPAADIDPIEFFINLVLNTVPSWADIFSIHLKCTCKICSIYCMSYLLFILNYFMMLALPHIHIQEVFPKIILNTHTELLHPHAVNATMNDISMISIIKMLNSVPFPLKLVDNYMNCIVCEGFPKTQLRH